MAAEVEIKPLPRPRRLEETEEAGVLRARLVLVEIPETREALRLYFV